MVIKIWINQLTVGEIEANPKDEIKSIINYGSIETEGGHVHTPFVGMFVAIA